MGGKGNETVGSGVVNVRSVASEVDGGREMSEELRGS